MESANDYLRYKHEKILPYAGGYRDQPWWIQRDFTYFQYVEMWLENEAPTRSELEAAGVTSASEIDSR